MVILRELKSGIVLTGNSGCAVKNMGSALLGDQAGGLAPIGLVASDNLLHPDFLRFSREGSTTSYMSLPARLCLTKFDPVLRFRSVSHSPLHIYVLQCPESLGFAENREMLLRSANLPNTRGRVTWKSNSSAASILIHTFCGPALASHQHRYKGRGRLAANSSFVTCPRPIFSSIHLAALNHQRPTCASPPLLWLFLLLWRLRALALVEQAVVVVTSQAVIACQQVLGMRLPVAILIVDARVETLDSVFMYVSIATLSFLEMIGITERFNSFSHSPSPIHRRIDG